MRTTAGNSLHSRDVAHVLHPYTNARLHERKGPVVIARGKGVHVYDDEGKEYIDGLAGLWSVAVGFGEERLSRAAMRQMDILPYYHTFSHKSHDPCIALAEKLVDITDDRLSHVFFTNSGSEATDTVVKLIWYYNNVLGRPEKKKIISRFGAYHGVTVAAGSLTGLPWVHADFDLPIANIIHTACPHHSRFAADGEDEDAFSQRMADELEQLILSEGPDTVAAFIGEPVMAAGGVIVPPPDYWKKIHAVCRKYDVLLIADEVITGFGRLGRMFGCECFGIEPDMLVLSKQITSSYMPLAAVLMTDELYDAIADGSEAVGTLGHGFTGSGHPVATAVALENLKVIEERDLVSNAAAMGEALRDRLHKLKDHPLVGEVRGCGLIAAVELVAEKRPKRSVEPEGRLGAYVFERAHNHGLILRNIRDSIAFCPPLIVSEDQVEEIVDRFTKTLNDAAVLFKDGAFLGDGRA